jgi:hypothetical protein
LNRVNGQRRVRPLTGSIPRSSWLSTIGLAVVAVIAVLLPMELASVYLPVLGNPLVLITAAVVAIGLVLLYRLR